MWRSHRTVPMLEKLCYDRYVTEIIIIDNNKSVRPEIPHSSKIKLLEQEENIYCNPAWNLGVANCKNSICVLLNDDVTFDTKFLKVMADGLEHYGVIGVHHDSYGSLYQGREIKEEEEGELEYDGGPPRGWGCVLCFKTKDYVDIPSEFKVWVGDDWIERAIGNVCSIRMNVQTEMSTTSDMPELEKMKWDELRAFRIGLEDGTYSFN